MHVEAMLSAQASEAIRARRLPPQRPHKVLGGPGSGETCAVCREPVAAEQLGFEFELMLDLGLRAVAQLHVRCFRAYERACREQAEARDSDSLGLAGESA